MIFYHSNGAFCYVKIHKGFVIVTEPLNNPGKSVTNAWPDLQDSISATLNIYVSDYNWIEHYEHRNKNEDTYDLVVCENKKVQWIRIPSELASHLLKKNNSIVTRLDKEKIQEVPNEPTPIQEGVLFTTR